jgi:hypothetical protein
MAMMMRIVFTSVSSRLTQKTQPRRASHVNRAAGLQPLPGVGCGDLFGRFITSKLNDNMKHPRN